MDFFVPHPDPRTPGRSIVVLPIYNAPDLPVTMFAEDYDRWVAAHGVRTLRLISVEGNTRVTFRSQHPRRTIGLARFVMGEPTARQVFIVDGDCCNLRRTNLTMKDGGRGGMFTVAAAPAIKAKPPKKPPMTFREAFRTATNARPR